MRDAFHSAGWKLYGLARQSLSSLPDQPGYQHQGLNLPHLAVPSSSHTAKAIAKCRLGTSGISRGSLSYTAIPSHSAVGVPASPQVPGEGL